MINPLRQLHLYEEEKIMNSLTLMLLMVRKGMLLHQTFSKRRRRPNPQKIFPSLMKMKSFMKRIPAYPPADYSLLLERLKNSETLRVEGGAKFRREFNELLSRASSCVTSYNSDVVTISSTREVSKALMTKAYKSTPQIHFQHICS